MILLMIINLILTDRCLFEIAVHVRQTAIDQFGHLSARNQCELKISLKVREKGHDC